MHRSGGKCSALSALHSCSQRSFLALSDGSILGLPTKKRHVIDSEVSRILSYVQRRSNTLDVYHNNFLDGKNSTIANQEQARSVTLTPTMNSIADKTSTGTCTEPYASIITATSSLKNSSSGANCWTALIHKVLFWLESLFVEHIQKGFYSSAVEQFFAAQIGVFHIQPKENGNYRLVIVFGEKSGRLVLHSLFKRPKCL